MKLNKKSSQYNTYSLFSITDTLNSTHFVLLMSCLDCAIARAGRHSLHTIIPWVQFQKNFTGYLCTRWAPRQVALQALQFSPASLSFHQSPIPIYYQGLVKQAHWDGSTKVPCLTPYLGVSLKVCGNSWFIMPLFSWKLCMVWNMLNTHILEADFTPIFRFHAVPCTQLLTDFRNYVSRTMSLTVSWHIFKNVLRPCLITAKTQTYPIVRTSTTLYLKIVSRLIWH
jgi:hypothetical protein